VVSCENSKIHNEEFILREKWDLAGEEDGVVCDRFSDSLGDDKLKINR
jgi:hypothetical protein